MTCAASPSESRVGASASSACSQQNDVASTSFGEPVEIAVLDNDIEATAIGESATSVEGVRIVQIDRPFRYFIRDRESNAIPFIGHIADPTVTAAL